MDPLSIATSVVSVFLHVGGAYGTDPIVGRADSDVSFDLQETP